MRFEFNQGVPPGCVNWLWDNVGNGNRDRKDVNFSVGIIYGVDNPGYAWFYERIEQEIPSNDPAQDSNVKYVPTITVKDEKKSMLFALRWL